MTRRDFLGELPPGSTVLSREDTEKLREAHGVAGEWDGERCQRCGRAYALCWAAPNDLWNRIIGGEWGQRCPDCFVQECEAAGISPFLVCFPEHVNIDAALALLDGRKEEQ